MIVPNRRLVGTQINLGLAKLDREGKSVKKLGCWPTTLLLFTVFSVFVLTKQFFFMSFCFVMNKTKTKKKKDLGFAELNKLTKT